MKTLLNVIWLVFAGFWLATAYLLAAVLLAITIIGLPFAKQSLKLARYALWPFGRALVQSPTRNETLSAVGNVLWFVLAGWWLALAHIVTGVALCLTIAYLAVHTWIVASWSTWWYGGSFGMRPFVEALPIRHAAGRPPRRGHEAIAQSARDRRTARWLAPCSP